VDGTEFRLPVDGWWDMSGQDLEGYGVPPDIYVDNSFDDSARGFDRQLDEAVKTLMKK
jgi:tricorn protease